MNLIREKAKTFMAQHKLGKDDVIHRNDRRIAHGDLLELSDGACAGLSAVIDEAVQAGKLPRQTPEQTRAAFVAIRQVLTSYDVSLLLDGVAQNEYGPAFSRQVKKLGHLLEQAETALMELDTFVGPAGQHLPTRLRLSLLENRLADDIYGARTGAQRRLGMLDAIDLALTLRWVHDMRERVEPMVAGCSTTADEHPPGLRILVNGLGDVWSNVLGRGEAYARPTYSEDEVTQRQSLFLQFASIVSAEVTPSNSGSLKYVVRAYCAETRGTKKRRSKAKSPK